MRLDDRRIAVTGAAGFIGRNLVVRLKELGASVVAITRETSAAELGAEVGRADVVIHLAGAVRPSHADEFRRTADYAARVAEAVVQGGRRPLVICGSSARAGEGDGYGASKLAVEEALLTLDASGAARVAVFRLPNVFGKWARPNYNSVVATFCHELGRGLPIRIDDPDAPLSLLYVDDLIDQWRRMICEPPAEGGFFEATDVYETSVGEVAVTLDAFARTRRLAEVQQVGAGLERALYATFIAALPAEAFSYPLAAHRDERGCFAEMLRTGASGQISYFTAYPGVTRGGHYHHSKVEKFLIVYGEGLFRYRHILSGETFELRVCGDQPIVVETIPGWTHDVTNVGEGPLISLLWSSETFDRERPDTVAMAV